MFDKEMKKNLNNANNNDVDVVIKKLALSLFFYI